MAKNILTIGIEIPCYEEIEHVEYRSSRSLVEGDIIVFNPSIINRFSSYSSSNYKGKKKFESDESHKIFETMKHWKEEIDYSLEKGRTIFVVLNEYEEFYLEISNEVSSIPYEKDGKYLKINNYSQIPIDDLKVFPLRGKKIKGINDVYNMYCKEYTEFFEYETYIKSNSLIKTFLPNIGDRGLGGYVKKNNGYLVFIPAMSFYYSDFMGEDDSDDWPKETLKIGSKFLHLLLEIDKSLKSDENYCPSPDWINCYDYMTLKEEKLNSEKQKIENRFEILKNKLAQIEKDLQEESILKYLLFGTGKSLEVGVIRALKILGYKAENYNDGELELDQVIISPEGDRYIGECEGKDNYAIDINKIRQLGDELNEDMKKSDYANTTKGILFGNPCRLLPPSEREKDFTEKCLSAAKRLDVALIRTPDLFTVCKYIADTKDKEFAKQCRETIKNSFGGIVKFSEIPEVK